MQTQTLNALKKSLQVGDVLTLVDAPMNPGHKFLNRPRRLAKVQTNAIQFEPLDVEGRPFQSMFTGKQIGGSWLQWPKAADYRPEGADGFTILEDGKPCLTYKIERGSK